MKQAIKTIVNMAFIVGMFGFIIGYVNVLEIILK